MAKLQPAAVTRRREQRGNSFIETSLVLVPFMAIVFGLIDFSTVIFIQGTLQGAARQAVRFGITFTSTYGATNCNNGQSVCIAQVAKDNAMGFLSGSTNYITVNYYTPNSLTTPVMSCVSGTCTMVGTLPQTLANGTTVTYANQPGNVVEVVIAGFPWSWMVPIANYTPGTGLTLRASSADVLEGLVVGQLTPPTP
jgi:Flp pilus assembly protein TadG